MNGDFRCNMNRKIKIVWIVNDKYTNNFITVYRECLKSDKFLISIIAAPHLKQSFADEVSSSEIAHYLRSEGVECIDSYDINTDSYFDITTLEPDYVFTTTPYDIYLPEPYQSHNIMKVAKLCNVEYGAIIIECVGIYNYIFSNPYLSNASFNFYHSLLSEDMPSNFKCVGSLKLDEYLHYGRIINNSIWRKDSKIRVLWKPRWTAEEDDSTLFNYIEKFYFYLKDNPKIDFVFLRHPLLESNLNSKNLQYKYNTFMENLNKLDNFHIESSSNYLDTALSCDVLIADHSSILAECAVVGKIIIYTNTKAQLDFLGRSIVKDGYIANSFEDISVTLNNLLLGIDPKKEQREINKDNYFFTPPNGKSVAQYLLDVLYEDYQNVPLGLSYYKTIINNQEHDKIELNNKVSELEKQLDEYICMFKNLNNDLSSKMKTIDLLISENDILKTDITDLNIQLNKTKSRIEEILLSTSWKVTKPLRFISKKINDK